MKNLANPTWPKRRPRFCALIILMASLLATALGVLPMAFGASTSSGGKAPGAKALTIGERYHLNEPDIPLYQGPGPDAPRVPNDPTYKNTLPSDKYLQMQYFHEVVVEETRDGWARVRTVEPGYDSRTHKGWIEARFIQKEKISRDRVLQIMEAAQQRSREAHPELFSNKPDAPPAGVSNLSMNLILLICGAFIAGIMGLVLFLAWGYLTLRSSIISRFGLVADTATSESYRGLIEGRQARLRSLRIDLGNMRNMRYFRLDIEHKGSVDFPALIFTLKRSGGKPGQSGRVRPKQKKLDSLFEIFEEQGDQGLKLSHFINQAWADSLVELNGSVMTAMHLTVTITPELVTVEREALSIRDIERMVRCACLMAGEVEKLS